MEKLSGAAARTLMVSKKHKKNVGSRKIYKSIRKICKNLQWKCEIDNYIDTSRRYDVK